MMLSALSQNTKSLSTPLTQLSQQAGSSAGRPYLSALLKAPQSSLPDALSDDYFQLEQDFESILEQAKKQPVSDKNITPPWISALKDAARKPEWQKTLGEYVLDKYAAEVKGMQSQYAQRSLMLEQKEKEAAVASTSTQYSQLNSSMANFEAQVSGMTPDTAHAVFVGSGPQPNTVLSYAPFSKSVTGIDNDASAIPPAQAAAARSPYNRQIAFKQQEGKAVNYQDYSHIGMAIMIPTQAKIEILKQILNTAKTGTRVVVRSVDGLKKALYDGIKEEDIKSLTGKDPRHPSASPRVFKKVATLYGNDENVTHSYILEVAEKKEMPGSPQFGRLQKATRRLNLVG